MFQEQNIIFIEWQIGFSTSGLPLQERASFRLLLSGAPK
jgi:hypothetical protein